MTTPILVNVTASVGVDARYDSSVVFGMAAGLYVGGFGSTLLLWFAGDTAADQCEAMDRAIDALAALKREARAATQLPAEVDDPTGGRADAPHAPVAASLDVDDIPF